MWRPHSCRGRVELETEQQQGWARWGWAMENLLTCSPFFVSVAEAVCTSTSLGEVLGRAWEILGPALVHGKSWGSTGAVFWKSWEILGPALVHGKSWGSLGKSWGSREVLGYTGASSGPWEVLGKS